MSSTTFKKPTTKGDSAARALPGVVESWATKVILARNKLRLEFAGTVATKAHEEPVIFKYQLKYEEGEIESGDAYLYLLNPSKSTVSILPICLDDPMETVKKLRRYFKRPAPKTSLVTNDRQEEI